jgi:hypothetical protein
MTATIEPGAHTSFGALKQVDAGAERCAAVVALNGYLINSDCTAASFDSPDYVPIVIHDHRWRLGLAEGGPRRRLTSTATDAERR